MVALSRVMIGAIIVSALSWGRALLMPIALAVLLTFLLNPIVRRLQAFGLGRMVSVVLAVTIAGSTLTFVGITGSRQVSSLLATLPEYTAKIVNKVKAMKALVSGPTAHRFEQMIEEISHELQLPGTAAADDANQSDESTSEVSRIVVKAEPVNWSMLTGPLGSALEGMAMLAFALVLLVFFLMDREGLRDRIVLLAGKARLTVTSKALEDATNRVSRYVGMVAMVNGGFGLIMFAGLFVLGVPYAVLWGCVAALLRFIPYLGPWIGAIFPIVMSFAMLDGWWPPLTVFVFILVLELVTNNIIEPLAFGHMTGVAPTALLISAAIWLFLWGPIGLVLSAPFAVSLMVIGKNVPQLGFLYILLADQPALTDAGGLYQRLLLLDRQESSTIIENRLREPEPERFFDDLIVPVLANTKRELRRGHLTDDEASSLVTMLGDELLTTDLAAAMPSKPLSVPDTQAIRHRIYLVGCSTERDIDRVALTMLGMLLDPARWDIDVAADDVLTSEMVLHVTQDAPELICIAVVSPGGTGPGRWLCKKLHHAAAGIPILVALLGETRLSRDDRSRLIASGASGLTTTLIETRKWIDARHALLSQPPRPPSDETELPARYGPLHAERL